jgi:hypothetical protein
MSMQHPLQPEDEVPEALYGNIFRIGYNAYEFVLDFGQCHPPGKEHMHTRIVTSPASAKDLSELLQISLGEHEQKYGPGRTGE